MNRFRRMVPGLVLGLTLSIAGVGFAQSMSPAKTDERPETCCCMASDCCGDSCPMKHGEKKNHAGAADKHACCCGDSCSMKDSAPDGAMKASAMAEKHACCCEGDSCAMMKDGAMNHDAMKQGAAKAGKHEGCCCCGDSCNMKDKKEMKSKS